MREAGYADVGVSSVGPLAMTGETATLQFLRRVGDEGAVPAAVGLAPRDRWKRGSEGLASTRTWARPCGLSARRFRDSPDLRPEP